MLTQQIINTYTKVLREELILAMGCTEPIAIAYAASVARQALGRCPDSIKAGFSGNIIKNVKSVIVPMTDGQRGIDVALAAGIIANAPERHLEVLCALSEEDKAGISRYLKESKIEVYKIEDSPTFEIDLTVFAEGHSARVRMLDSHTNIVCVLQDDADVTEKYRVFMVAQQQTQYEEADRSLLNVEDIVEFADTVELSDIAPLLREQIKYNMQIAEEGLRGEWGACIGKMLYNGGDCGLRNRARAYAAAASDARMSGCELPVCIISGSGNQGITASVPVAVYAENIKVDEETLLRALIISDLITVHQKTGIGCLSAYCGAISAGCGCGCGIAYLYGGRFVEIAHTLVNAVAILSGTICDGAKPSCAAKIAMAVEAGIVGYEMYRAGNQFYGGDGIVSKGVENTIKNVGRLAREGMKETDEEIIDIMLSK
ncbi:MAG: serine dehydratase subunit alpha family protein [Clostridia bacterium]|nr:serine dehydratase subunit alpha family protein [Clostridia bacterium]